jgi:hypothetical protein
MKKKLLSRCLAPLRASAILTGFPRLGLMPVDPAQLLRSHQQVRGTRPRIRKITVMGLALCRHLTEMKTLAPATWAPALTNPDRRNPKWFRPSLTKVQLMLHRFPLYRFHLHLRRQLQTGRFYRDPASTTDQVTRQDHLFPRQASGCSLRRQEQEEGCFPEGS